MPYTMTRVCPDCGETYEVEYGEGMTANFDHGCKQAKKPKKKSEEKQDESEEK